MLKSFINAISSLGSKESKVNPLSFEDARSRLTESERSRFSEAFKRVATTNTYISRAAFCREVLGELFPSKIAECIFDACGGSNKGIAYKDVVTGLVLLTKGSADEKIRFIFALYSADGNAIIKDDFLRFTAEVESIVIPDTLLTRLFSYSNSIEYEHFARWLKSNPNATSFSAWLLGDDFVLTPGGYKHKSFKLTDDHDTPTFYQTLAGVTHLEEEGIIELEKRYWKLHENSRNGKMDIHTLSPLISPPLPESIVQEFIDAFDENRDGHIDFKEMACGVSAAARGPLIERQKFCFKIFDQDKDGLLSVSEVRRMVNVMKLVMQDNLSDSPSEDVIMILTRDDEQIVQEVFMSAVNGEGMTLEEYLVWSLSNRLPEQFLSLIYQICQIILGLKPLDPLEEYECVSAWLTREEKRGLKHGQIWYLISMDWWTSWFNYACPHNSVMSNSDSGMVSISGSIASQSNSIANMSDTNSNIGNGNGNGNGNKNEGSSKSSSSVRCWSTKKSTVENSVAMDLSQNVVVTAISSYDMDYDSGTPTPTPTPSLFSPNGKSSSSSLSLVTLDSSSSPSPVNSPSVARKQLNGSLNGYGRGLVQSRRRRPDAIDNSSLLAPSVTGAVRVPSLTSEGGRLKRDLVADRDFKAVPQVLWNALYQWYGAGVPLARQVIQNEKKLELELYPLTLLLYRHQTTTNAAGKPATTNSAPWTGMAGMYGANALSTTISYVQNHNLSPPKRVLAFTASFSRLTLLRVTWLFICQKLRLSMQDLRLDLLTNDDLSFAVVLEEEDQTLEELGVRDLSNVLMEVKNKDQTWPEEIGSLASNSEQMRLKRMASVSVEKGLTGLNNLGNTCFMNSAIQCVSNTRPLTHYFSKKMHMYELNRTNPLGMKGHIAKRYGDLITDIWSGTAKTMAPFKLRWTIGKYAPRFSGFQQNDAQELLAFLLDGLHEDLNRVAEKPYVELKDSDNRPDVICAQEAWENHLLRNKSIIVDLFHGQLKSSVRCKECSHESVRFDPFNFLTLPLPMESYTFCDVVVIPANGTVPIRYGLLMSIDEYISDVKYRLAELTSSDESTFIPFDKLLIVQISNHRIQHIFRDDEKVKSGASAIRPLYAFEVYANEGNARPNGDTVADQQIRKIMTSSKNQNAQGPLLKPQQPVENGGMIVHGHSRQNSYSSNFSTGPASLTELPVTTTLTWNVISVVHRKMMRQESYFVAPQKSRPLLFGLPILVPFTEGMTHLELYKRVWDLVGRLVTPLPPAEGPGIYNHAMDCDDSLGYEYPFVLTIVTKDAEWACGRCAWHAFCRGCPLMCSEEERLERSSLQNCAVAIDWDPTALHLRYQTTQEFETIEHASVAQALRRQAESVSLNSCLDTFTKEEELGEDEKYYCAKCGNHQLASKKLQIWRLPPVLIVHLKRFQSMNNRWIKSHKVVEFPFHDFDPTKYLADVPRKTIELAQKKGSTAANSEAGDSLLFPLQDFHQHRLLADSDGFNLNYRLFAIICHSGIMGGGHYIAYARNPEGKWHCFNDSSCKEVQEDQIETHSAYILFYERNGLDCDSFMPRIDPRTMPVITDDELEAEENDLKKLCVIS